MNSRYVAVATLLVMTGLTAEAEHLTGMGKSGEKW